jgi:site-specific DNA-methyltransferase (cytosine-N4-specific)
MPQLFELITSRFGKLGPGNHRIRVGYKTALGVYIRGKAENALPEIERCGFSRGINLVFTSPPFPLNTKKRYGNLNGQEYVDWLASFAPKFVDLLTPSGSIVLEMGNAWEPGQPVMSTLALKALLAFLEKGKLQLCQQFVWCNPAKLPTPAQWVNIERIRVKDAFTHLWWMAPKLRPKASNRRILTEYSAAMHELLTRRKYSSGRRPSQHHIGKTSFLTNNGGAIPSNVLTCANTQSNCDYLTYCRAHKITPHPARMPLDVARFFIKFLTQKGDIVLDPFGGSNVTGAAAESLGRKWICVERKTEYIRASKARFSVTTAGLSGNGRH